MGNQNHEKYSQVQMITMRNIHDGVDRGAQMNMKASAEMMREVMENVADIPEAPFD